MDTILNVHVVMTRLTECMIELELAGRDFLISCAASTVLLGVIASLLFYLIVNTLIDGLE